MKRWAGVVIACALVVAACGGSGGSSSGGGNDSGGSSSGGGNDSGFPAEVSERLKQACIRSASDGAKVTERVTSACQCIADYVEKHATLADIKEMERTGDTSAITKLGTKAGHACT